MMIGKNLIIISTLSFLFLVTNISYAVETKEEFVTEKPSIKLHKKSDKPTPNKLIFNTYNEKKTQTIQIIFLMTITRTINSGFLKPRSTGSAQLLTMVLYGNANMRMV